MPIKQKYYQATRALLEFLEQLDGSYEQFARKSGCSARTIARLRNGGRINRETMNGVMKSAQAKGLKLSREKAFVPMEEGENNNG